MAGLKETARLIPDKVRSLKLITDADPISNAIAVSSNYDMMELAEIWYTFIEPHKEKTYCPICLNNILNNFKNMRSVLIELEKEYKTINAL
jgi:hypothetical protein